MKLDRGQVDRFLKQPDPRFAAVLIYGPDSGMVRERGSQLTRQVAESLDDPFRVVEFTADQIKGDPVRLLDEAQAIGMMGGRRVVRVSGAGDSLADACESLLEAHRSSQDCLVVVEAEDIAGKSRLRGVFEAAPNAATIACYHDEAASLGGLVQEQIRQAGYGVSREALDYLAQSLGGDRGVTRSEIDKLLLYKGEDKSEISLAEAMTCIGDRAAFALDDLIDAVCSGDLKALDKQFERNIVELPPIVMLRRMSAHFLRLHPMVERLRQGERLEQVFAAARPPIPWPAKQRYERHCRIWTPAAIGLALNQLMETEAQAMRQHALAEAITRRGFIDIAATARRLRERGGARK
ncbi:MAG TPA: DNA polymerase III subunit delta [Terriglobia bacterium]|nr:DNA polymerase III subunit delta [Terriglobia bacterium]